MTALVDDVTELLILWPHLADALARDGGTSAAPVTTGGADPAFGLPVNADVFGALASLQAEVPGLAQWAAQITAEPHHARDIGGHLRHMPRWHERMLVTAAIGEAAHLAASLHALLLDVKLALGLRTPSRRLGQFCPLHDVPLTELVVPGDEASLRYSRLDREGQPIEATVQWDRRDVALCGYCGASWAPSQYLMLGRLLREADARRLDATMDPA